MANYRVKNAISRTAQGAAIGSVFGPVGTGVGVGVGFISSLFESDPEEELRRRKEAMLAEINANRAKRMVQITKESANARGASAQAAMARAIDTGRDPSNIEDTLLVANQQNVQAANSAINQANQVFDDQALQVEGEYQSRPLQPTLTDTLINAGTNAVAGYYQNKASEQTQQYLDTYKKNVENQTGYGIPTSTAPSVKTGETGIIRSPLQFDNLAMQPQGLIPSSPRYIQTMKNRNINQSFVPSYGY